VIKKKKKKKVSKYNIYNVFIFIYSFFKNVYTLIIYFDNITTILNVK